MLALALAGAGAYAAEPNDYPMRPVRVILPQGPGSTTDLLGRIVFTHTATGSPGDFGKLIRVEHEQMGKLVKLAGIKTE
jgi:hypothetical protein